MGAPTYIHGGKIDQRVIDRLDEGVRLGLTRVLAARYAGIAPSTLFRWLARARGGDATYVPVLDVIDAAEAQCAAHHLAVVQQAGQNGSWQASAWVLERRFGYVRTERREVEAEHTVQHSVQPGTPEYSALFAETVSQLPRDMQRELLEKLPPELLTELASRHSGESE